MFRGFNKPSRQRIFGPSNSEGGSWADSRRGSLYMRGEGLPWNEHRNTYMRGEGLGSMFGSIFRKIIPFASKAVKKIASSQIVKDVGKQALDTSVNALTNVAANTISGEKGAGEAISDELQNARKEIGAAIRKSSLKRKKYDEEVDLSPPKSRRKKNKNVRKKAVTRKIKRKTFRKSVFDSDDDEDDD